MHFDGTHPDGIREITSPRDAAAVLDDPRFVVPPVADAAVPHGLAWLRAGVSRFSSGAVHRRRRALVERELSRIEPATLRAAARADPQAHPVAILATALGYPHPSIVDDVRIVAAAYQPGTGPEPPADGAVARLVDRLGGVADERTAGRICLLVQACDATAVLTERARSRSERDVDAALEAVLRLDPPVTGTRRLALAPARFAGVTVEAGEVVRVSLLALPFGAGPRRCPGERHAMALAAGALEAPSHSHPS